MSTSSSHWGSQSWVNDPTRDMTTTEEREKKKSPVYCWPSFHNDVLLVYVQHHIHKTPCLFPSSCSSGTQHQTCIFFSLDAFLFAELHKVRPLLQFVLIAPNSSAVSFFKFCTICSIADGCSTTSSSS